MSWRDAPLYVEAHDLARWVLERAAAWHDRTTPAFASQTTSAVCDLVTAVSLALTFPATRPSHLETADEAVVRLRVLLRLAQELGLISPGGLRHASGRLLVIGRMIGGWRKRTTTDEPVVTPPLATHRKSGDGLPMASSG